MAAYGAISLPAEQPPGRSGFRPGRRALAAAAGLAALSAVLAVASQLQLQQTTAGALMQMNMVPMSQSQMLCEGHFLDTATGIPEGTFSTLHHPGEMEGYQEPLPPEMRAAIDAEIYGSMVSSCSRAHMSCVSCVCIARLALRAVDASCQRVAKVGKWPKYALRTAAVYLSGAAVSSC
jgi:hypothetical protein